MPFAGHVRPMTAVAAALLARGHRVTAYTGDRHVEAFDRLGAGFAISARDLDLRGAGDGVADAIRLQGAPGARASAAP